VNKGHRYESENEVEEEEKERQYTHGPSEQDEMGEYVNADINN